MILGELCVCRISINLLDNLLSLYNQMRDEISVYPTYPVVN